MNEVNGITRDNTDSVNQTQIEKIVHEIFDSHSVARPSNVVFERLPVDSLAKPSARLTKGVLSIRASSEVEARKIICLQALRQEWSWKTWILATRIGLSVALTGVAYVIVLAGGWCIHWTLPEDFRIFGDVVAGLLLLIPLYLMMKMPVWSEYARREVVSSLLEANGLSEYETDYIYQDYSIIIGVNYLGIYAICGIIMLSTTRVGFDLLLFFLLTSLLTLIPSIGLPIALESRNEKKYGRCIKYEELSIINQEEPEGMTSPEALELRETMIELSQLLEIEDSYNPDTRTILPIEVVYHQVSIPMCRNCDYSFEDERVLLDIRDRDVTTAKRLLASTLVWKQIVLTRPLKATLGAFIAGTALPLLMFIVCQIIGIYGLSLAVIGLSLFFVLTKKSMQIEESTRQAVHVSLERTGLFSQRLLSIYAYRTFPKSRNFELQFAAGIVILYTFMVFLVFIFQ